MRALLDDQAERIRLGQRRARAARFEHLVGMDRHAVQPLGRGQRDHPRRRRQDHAAEQHRRRRCRRGGCRWTPIRRRARTDTARRAAAAHRAAHSRRPARRRTTPRNRRGRSRAGCPSPVPVRSRARHRGVHAATSSACPRCSCRRPVARMPRPRPRHGSTRCARPVRRCGARCATSRGPAMLWPSRSKPTPMLPTLAGANARTGSRSALMRQLRWRRPERRSAHRAPARSSARRRTRPPRSLAARRPAPAPPADSRE